MSELGKQIEKLRRCELLTEEEVKSLCAKAKEIFAKEGNVLRVDAPVTVCGDIRGQIHDLKKIFTIGGDCPKVNYLFLGNFGDEGYHSVETFLLLLALKVKYPDRITLIRGNHESRLLSKKFGLYDECQKKYGTVNVWKYCTDVFDYLSLAAVIENKIFAVHGGLSPSITTLDQLRALNRKQELPTEGPMCDLLWSDPEETVLGWQLSPRGYGYLFGARIANVFNHENKIDYICRAHQWTKDGYKWLFSQQLVTVWSAPKYRTTFDNQAAFLELGENLEYNFFVFQPAEEVSSSGPY